jgi:hypothetical protein
MLRVTCFEQNVLRAKCNLTYYFAFSIPFVALHSGSCSEPHPKILTAQISCSLVRSENILQLREISVWYCVLRCQLSAHNIFISLIQLYHNSITICEVILFNYLVCSMKSIMSTALRSDLRPLWPLAVWNSANSWHRPRDNAMRRASPSISY